MRRSQARCSAPAPKVRVATQLVEAPGGRLLWSQTAQVTLNDIFQLQDDLTHRIVESLSLPLSTREQRLLSRDAPATRALYEYFLRANELASDPKSWPIARDLYEQALQDDPCYAPAWAAARARAAADRKARAAAAARTWRARKRRCSGRSS